MKQRKKAVFICQSAIIAALYIVLTYISSLFGLGAGVIQLRLSEALCVLPAFTPAGIYGLTVGCLLANLLTGAVLLDVIAGTAATLIGAIGTYALRRYKWLMPLPAVVSNTVIIPFVLAYGYGMKQAVPLMMLTVGAGELLSVYVLGLLLYLGLQKRAKEIF